MISTAPRAACRAGRSRPCSAFPVASRARPAIARASPPPPREHLATDAGRRPPSPSTCSLRFSPVPTPRKNRPGSIAAPSRPPARRSPDASGSSGTSPLSRSAAARSHRDATEHRPHERALTLRVDPRVEVIRDEREREPALLRPTRVRDELERRVLLAESAYPSSTVTEVAPLGRVRRDQSLSEILSTGFWPDRAPSLPSYHPGPAGPCRPTSQRARRRARSSVAPTVEPRRHRASPSVSYTALRFAKRDRPEDSAQVVARLRWEHGVATRGTAK